LGGGRINLIINPKLDKPEPKRMNKEQLNI
jgi:hypothetical protein